MLSVISLCISEHSYCSALFKRLVLVYVHLKNRLNIYTKIPSPRECLNFGKAGRKYNDSRINILGALIEQVSKYAHVGHLYCWVYDERTSFCLSDGRPVSLDEVWSNVHPNYRQRLLQGPWETLTQQVMFINVSCLQISCQLLGREMLNTVDD